MTTTVQFPNLGLSFEVSRAAFTLFGFPIYWYGLLIGLGMILAVVFAFKKATAFGIDADRMIDVIMVGFVFAIVGARLYYVVFVDGSYTSLWDVVNLRDGGLAIYGGVIGAGLGVTAACKWRGVPLLPMLDLTATGFFIGQAVGRWGNFFNQEAFGSNTGGLLGMISPVTVSYLQYYEPWLTEKGMYVDPSAPVHPTFLYESAWCALGFLLLWRYAPRRRFHGEVALFYVLWYGAGRAFIEGLRTDSLMIGTVRVSQLLAVASVTAAGCLWFYWRQKTRGTPLQVPEIPPHTAAVRVEWDGEEREVTVHWPANTRPPDIQRRQEMALLLLRQEEAGDAETAGEGAPGEETETALPGEGAPAEGKAAGRAAESGKQPEKGAPGQRPPRKKNAAAKPERKADEAAEPAQAPRTAKRAKAAAPEKKEEEPDANAGV